MRKYIFLFLELIVIMPMSSCSLFLGTRNLGEGYYFDTDQIVYTEKKTYDGVGYSVVPPKILSMGKNDDFIIASSENNYGETKYWVIIKKANKKEIKYVEDSAYSGYYMYANVFGPLKEGEFNLVKEKCKIPNSLRLKPLD